MSSRLLGHDENDSMPIGNDDLAANLWTEPDVTCDRCVDIASQC
jgi:hypothetical protein